MPDVKSSIQPSKTFYAFQLGVLIVTCIILFIVSIPFFLKGFLLTAVMVDTFHILRTHTHYQFLVTDGQQWEFCSEKERVRGKLRGDSMITAWVMILRLAVPGKRQAVSCVLFPDALPTDVWRRLRVLA